VKGAVFPSRIDLIITVHDLTRLDAVLSVHTVPDNAMNVAFVRSLQVNLSIDDITEYLLIHRPHRRDSPV
jgi:hypothetical protein